jgi:hypothetical protein
VARDAIGLLMAGRRASSALAALGLRSLRSYLQRCAASTRVPHRPAASRRIISPTALAIASCPLVPRAARSWSRAARSWSLLSLTQGSVFYAGPDRTRVESALLLLRCNR